MIHLENIIKVLQKVISTSINTNSEEHNPVSKELQQ